MIMSKKYEKKSYCEKEQAGGMLKTRKERGKAYEAMGGISYSGSRSEKDFQDTNHMSGGPDFRIQPYGTGDDG